MLQSYGPTIDKKCVQDAITEAQSSQQASNSNSKSTSGGELTAGVTTGGNTASGSNTSGSSNENSTSGQSQTSGSASNQTSSDFGSTNTSDTTNQNSASTEQTSTASASGGQTGIGQGNGMSELYTFLLLFFLCIGVLYYMEKSNGPNGPKLYSTLIRMIKEYSCLFIIFMIILCNYLLNI